jgi:lysophospholipase L1-like esterase
LREKFDTQSLTFNSALINTYVRTPSLLTILLLTVWGQAWAQPATPGALSASTLSTSSILLSWSDNSADETGFQIERSSSESSGFVLITTTASNTTSYINTGLTPGTQYFYRIRTTNGSGNSVYSNVVSSTTGVRRFLIDFGSTTYRTTTIGWNNITAPTTGSVTSLVESNGAASTVSLQIVNDPSDGYGASSTAGYKQTLLDYPLTAVQDSHYGYQTGGAYRVNGLDNGMNYSLRFFGCRTGVTDSRKAVFTINGQQQILETTNNTQTIVFNNIVPISGSITIDFNVASGSDYAYLNVLDIVENQATPQPPTSLTAQASSSTQIILNWNDGSNNETSFQVERSATSGTGFLLIATLNANSTSYSDTGLSPTTQYFYRIRAINVLGASAYSAEASATTLAIPPATPIELVATANGPQITLSWTDSSDNEVGFQIERSLTSGGGFILLTTTTVNATSFLDAGLEGDTRYFYRVRAVNSGGSSAYSNEANATTQPAPPAAPTGLNAVAISSAQIHLNWVDNSTNETGFEIERADTSAVFTLISTTTTNAISFLDTGLTENTQYLYRIRSLNGAGASAYTSNASVITLPMPPAAPDSLNATTIAFSQINLSWQDLSTNETGFQIERSLTSESDFTLVAITSANTTTYSDINLSPQTNYFYRVKAINPGGSSNFTTESSATTFAGPPNAPTSLMASASSTTQINLSWVEASGNETGFQVEQSTSAAGNFTLITTTSANIDTYVDSGLQPGTTYFYRVRAINEVGSSSYTNTASTSTIPLIQPYGEIFNETSFASPTVFPIIGTAITRGTNKIILNGKPTTFSSYIYHDDPENPFRYTCLEEWKVRVRVKTPTSFNSSSTGIAIGVRSVNTYSAYTTLMRWSWVPGGNSVYLYNRASTSGQLISTTKYIPTANTYYWLEVTRNKDSFTYTVFDGSAGTNQLYRVTLTFPTFTAGNQVKAHNTGQFAIYQFGGTNTEIANWEVSTSAIKNADFIGVGDSNMHGMFALSNSDRWFEKAMTTAGKSFNILAASSERSVEVVKRLPEIVALSPKAVVLSIGRNDLANAIPLATVQSNINTIISTLEGAGITVYLAGVIASNTNVSALQNFYSAKSNIKINGFAATKSATSNSLAAAYSSGDGIHLNQAGNTLLANLLLTIIPESRSSQNREAGTQADSIAPETEISDQPQINLYPNPARTEITVKVTHAPPHAIMIHVFDLLGKPASSIEANTEQDTVIDLLALPSGMYVIKVNLNGRMYSKTFIKKD